MTISMYQASIPPMVRALNNLIGILEKGAAHAESKGIDASILINARLFPDMFPLAKQIQIASDVSRRGAARLAGTEAPAMEDNESTFPELIARLRATIEYLETFAPEQIDGSEENIITLPVKDDVYKFPGLPYLLSFVMPNVYFHVTTAYDILRHCGVEIGKIDYLGQPN
ncbi:hypothetical protein C1752_02420 [Acaryochloris thomasi RCC1774]|uniref:DUF1993 domain-containing protein n=1 Tax=Acaryochloris thomasi RCC1774 TaxID=1764569 RepID=A0A2W1JPH8_9CYAN|nr:DUF1993 domain-containing protein [Acaryochloris thomasi]PZD73325.1 hypothetical protein C1752_02420 [Acaryochloris thomasi RCC1774]